MSSTGVLLLPGWQNSGDDHWQTLWEQRFGYARVEQDDWWSPRPADWLARLDDVVQRHDGPILLAAHSLGCHLAAAWAARSPHARRIAGALLVAPPDIEREDTPPQLHSWRPTVRDRLPFAAVAVVSQDDPHCEFERAVDLVRGWGADLVVAGRRGHLNAESGLGDWTEGHELLHALAAGETAGS
jgi:predicted alpha/beta hydrolase family esterase